MTQQFRLPRADGRLQSGELSPCQTLILGSMSASPFPYSCRGVDPQTARTRLIVNNVLQSFTCAKTAAELSPGQLSMAIDIQAAGHHGTSSAAYCYGQHCTAPSTSPTWLHIFNRHKGQEVVTNRSISLLRYQSLAPSPDSETAHSVVPAGGDYSAAAAQLSGCGHPPRWNLIRTKI